MNGLPKFSVLPTNSTVFPTTLFGSKTKGSTWKKNRGPRSSLDMLGFSMMMMTHTMTTKTTVMAMIQTLLSHSRHSSDLKEKFKISLLKILQWNPILHSPRQYSHLFITAAVFCPSETPAHIFFKENPVNKVATPCPTPLIRLYASTSHILKSRLVYPFLIMPLETVMFIFLSLMY